MINKLLKDEAFAQMMADHAADVLDMLLQMQTPFGVLCNLSQVHFDPPLPESLQEGLKPLTLFLLSGYTLESAELDEEMLYLSFEAGFGEENFGSVVTLPTDAILQITIDESVIFLNLAATVVPKRTERSTTEEGVPNGSMEHSIRSFLNNPENKKFFKK
jgi:hypothetical protein